MWVDYPHQLPPIRITIFAPTPGNDLIYNNQDQLYGTLVYASYLLVFIGVELPLISGMAVMVVL